MANLKKDYFYLDFMSNKKSKQWRCRVQLNGKRWIKYFDTKEEAELYREEINSQKRKVYKKGEVQYFSLKTLFDEYMEDKKLEWAGSTFNMRYYHFNVFKDYHNEWFHLISKSMCEEILSNEKNIHREKFFYAFFLLDEINKFSTDKYNYSLDWSVGLFRKKIKIHKGSRKQPREYHTKDEIKSITSFLVNYDFADVDDKRKVIRNPLMMYHIYRLGLSLGCRGGELCSLKKKNFNKKTRTLLINSTISRGRDKRWFDSQITKTKESRLNQLSDMAIESIEWLSSHSTSEFIIPNITRTKNYEFTSIVNLRDKFKPILDLLGIPWIGTHGMFRKTFATHIAMNSDKNHRDMIASIQKHLGHKSPQMTLHYIQAIDTDLSDELSKLDDLI